MTRQSIMMWGLAVTIFLTFLSVAVFATLTTMRMERSKKGFRSIEVEQPINGFDTTYLESDQAKSAVTPAKTPALH